jgi:hypothetical protein
MKYLEKNVKHVESSKLIRNKNINLNRDVKELRKEIYVLKNHIEKLNITQGSQNQVKIILIVIVKLEIKIIKISGKIILITTIIDDKGRCST